MNNKSTFPASVIVFLSFLFLLFLALVGGIVYYAYNHGVPSVKSISQEVNNQINQATTSQTQLKENGETVAASLALNKQGMDYYDKNDYKNAEIYYRKAIATDPLIANSYNNLGIVLELTNRPDEALVNFKKAIEIDPKYANAYNNLGTHYENVKDYKKAIEYFKKAIQVDGNVYKPYVHLGDIYMTLGDNASAKVYYQKSLESTMIDSQTIENVQTQLKTIQRIQSR